MTKTLVSKIVYASNLQGNFYKCTLFFCGTLIFKVLPLSLPPHTHTHNPHHKLVDICKYTLIYTRVCVCVCVERGGKRIPFSN